MRAVLIQAVDQLSFVEVPIPVPPPGWALVRLKACGVCATDIEILRGGMPVTYPLIPGHEWSGVVEALGSETDAGWLGGRVAGENEVSCLICTACRTGHWRYCKEYQQIGFGRYGGGYADYLVVPVYDLHRLPDNISFEQGALLEPLAVAFGAVTRAGMRVGDTVTILGDGSIGLHCLLVALRAGARRVVFVGGQSARLAVAAKLGATHVVDFREGSVAETVASAHGRSDIVIEATGSAEGIAQSVDLVRKDGVVALASYTPAHKGALSHSGVHNANVTVIGISGGAGWMGRAHACVCDGLIDSEPIISHRYEIGEYAMAMRQCETRDGDLVKSMFIW
jgi:L-iditol 2-dehydrogenase